MEPTKMSMGGWVMLIIGLVVGFLIGWGVYGRPAEAPADSSDLEALLESGDLASSTVAADLTNLTANVIASDDETTTPVAGDQFAVANQPASALVLVTNVSVSDVTWVAVRDYQNGGRLGNVLGARWVSGGPYPSVFVELLRPTVAGQTYAVTLYRDDGDKLFSSKKDSLVEQDGAPLL